MKISFDFDGTLSRKDVQEFAKRLIDLGHDIWITTSRTSTESAISKGWHWVEKQNQELYDVAESVGIPTQNIVFTELVKKIEFLKGKNFILHIDDDVDELMAIVESRDACKPINVDHFEWKERCEKTLQNYLRN